MEIGELKEAQVCIAPQPLVYRWGGRDGPLPLRVIQPRQVGSLRTHHMASQPWHDSGAKGQPFDFTGHIQRLCAEIVSRTEELRHIDVSRLLFCVTQARNGRVFGLQARVTPLRFPRGQLTRQRRGVTYQVQRYFHGATEFLYLVTFCLPRFLDQEFDDKFITLFHELRHINPAFDGDLYRHDGRYCVHTRSQKQYDQRMALLAREYLAGQPDSGLHAFLRLNFSQLVERHGSVTGIVVPRPKMVPVMLAAASRQK
jgi:Putative phage metallopeptidase